MVITEAIFSIVMTGVSTVLIMSFFYAVFKHDALFSSVVKKNDPIYHFSTIFEKDCFSSNEAYFSDSTVELEMNDKYITYHFKKDEIIRVQHFLRDTFQINYENLFVHGVSKNNRISFDELSFDILFDEQKTNYSVYKLTSSYSNYPAIKDTTYVGS